MIGRRSRFLLLAALAPSILAAVDLKVSCAKPGTWTIQTVQTAKGEVEEYEIRLSAPSAAVPPVFEASFDVPQIDAHHKWTTQMERVNMPPNWGGRTTSGLCSSLPLVAFLNDSDRNRLCVAVREAKRTVVFSAGIREEGCRIEWKASFFTEPEAPISSYAVKIRIDSRDVFFGDAIREGTDWIVRTAGLTPAEPPAAAFEPLYSAWYSFHQNVFDKEIEAECAEAAKLGMKTLIVDDGWQTDDNSRGYAFCGDWAISKRRFPDMAAHVRNVHALGMKYMVWYSVPFVGKKSANFARFRGKYLYSNDHLGASVLDPRFPEVREFLIGVYEKALREWDIDGFKLDFIDSFRFQGADPAVKENYAGRDVKTVPEAVDILMKTILARLKAVKPDVLVEFRQSYIGPAIRTYGNMLRAADCPGDLLANRCRTANLRLTSGDTAVHADMLEWNLDDTAENAARYVLSTIFSTIQYSVMLREAPEEHKRMIAHWIAFARAHLDCLQRGAFRPHHFEAMYPWIEAENPRERIVGVYTGGTVVPADLKKTTFVLNGTGEGLVYVDAAREGRAAIYDTFGREAGSVVLASGVNRVKVPVSGYLKAEGNAR